MGNWEGGRYVEVMEGEGLGKWGRYWAGPCRKRISEWSRNAREAFVGPVVGTDYVGEA